ncbi:MAG: amidohydrolase [Chloroflexi bacterium]|nr:amidohydrolase [Chloroflexota bacterium]
MSERADAHIHLFEGGYCGSLAGRPGVQLDEVALYSALAAEHGVRCALVVGYAGEPWCTSNNAWIAAQARKHAWMRPLAYVDPTQPLTVGQLEALQAQGFVGIVLYLLEQAYCEALGRISVDVWGWLAERRWIVSVNSRGELWSAWRGILDQQGELRLLVSHLGLPPRVGAPPSPADAAQAMAPVLALAQYPGPRVKLSGFYALTEPGYDYPHRAAWPYVVALLAAYGAGRLLWASDFSPCLDNLTFPQTWGLFAHMPFLSAAERRQIEGANLLALLGER